MAVFTVNKLCVCCYVILVSVADMGMAFSCYHGAFDRDYKKDIYSSPSIQHKRPLISHVTTCCMYCCSECSLCNEKNIIVLPVHHNIVQSTPPSIFPETHTLDWMIYLEGTLKCPLGLREEENDPVGEFLCITGHYTSGLRATHPPLAKMRDQENHFLPGSNGRNVECMGWWFQMFHVWKLLKGYTLVCSTKSIYNALPRSNLLQNVNLSGTWLT